MKDNKELSNTDKKEELEFKKFIDKWAKKAQEIDWSNMEQVGKEVKKIRLKVLRKLLLLKWKEFLFYNDPIENGYFSSLTLESIMSQWGCEKREAYDYLRFNVLMSSLNQATEMEFYKFLAETTKLMSNADKKQNEQN